LEHPKLLLKVKVNYPKDMSILENKVAKVLAKILVKKLSEKEIDTLIEILKDDNINIHL
jgi:hypothetical protein